VKCFNEYCKILETEIDGWIYKPKCLALLKNKEDMIKSLKKAIEIKKECKVELINDSDFKEYLNDSDFLELLK